MRSPLPKNKLVAFTLAGALLTAVVAGGLAFPIPGLTASGDGGDSGVSPGTPDAVADAPTPAEDFTPAVQTQTGYEDEEHEAAEDSDEEHEAAEDDDHERVEERDDDHESGEE